MTTPATTYPATQDWVEIWKQQTFATGTTFSEMNNIFEFENHANDHTQQAGLMSTMKVTTNDVT